MEERLKQIMADVFLLDISEINENSSPDSIPQWDSIGHLNLVTAIEEEFGIKIEDDQITQMLNFKLVIEIIKESQQA
jgi:acyl carrier protein